MTRAYLLDTQIVSYMTRRDPLVLLYDDVLEHDSQLLISVQTEAEILFGCLKAGWGARRVDALHLFLARFRVVPIDRQTGKIWAEIQSKSSALGRRMSAQDCWIAATAIQFELPLVAHDKDFISMPGLTLIRRS
jgi:predicted nucleic acid-binding protein